MEQQEEVNPVKRGELVTALSNYITGRNLTFEIKEVTLHEKFLSPVRNQGITGVGGYVACAACIEMLCRSLDILKEKDFLDIGEVHDNLHKRDRSKNIERSLNVKNEAATVGKHVLDYAKEDGFAVTTVAQSQRVKNLYSVFCTECKRQKIHSYEKLEDEERVFSLSTKYPMIASANVCRGFLDWEEIIYDSRRFENAGYYTMTVVGNARLRDKEKGEDHKYLLLQNSCGKNWGFKGYVFIPIKKKLLHRFYIPIITEAMEVAMDGGG